MTDNDYLGTDKLKHFGACLVLSIISPWLAAGCAITKEWCDSKNTDNHWCWWDLLADGLGIALGTLIRYYIINTIWK